MDVTYCLTGRSVIGLWILSFFCCALLRFLNSHHALCRFEALNSEETAEIVSFSKICKLLDGVELLLPWLVAVVASVASASHKSGLGRGHMTFPHWPARPSFLARASVHVHT